MTIHKGYAWVWAAGVAGAFAIVWIVSGSFGVGHRSEWTRTVQAFRTLSLEEVGPAVKAFVADTKVTNGVVPAMVSIRELVAAGYLKSDAAEPFGGIETFLSTDIEDVETYLQKILAEARLQDGMVIVLLADGSIQQLNPKRYQDLTNQAQAQSP